MRVNRYKQWARYYFGSNNKGYKKYKEEWKEMFKKNKPVIHSTHGYIDPTFQWHRDYHGMNIVSFNRKGESFKTYVIKGRK